jgi:hypothetical protein
VIYSYQSSICTKCEKMPFAIRPRCLGLLLGILGVFSTKCHAQAEPEALRKVSLEVGVGFSLAHPDYGDKLVGGITGFAVADLPHRIGIEVEYHNVDLSTPFDIGEVSFLGGIRYRFTTERRLVPYVKAMAGAGQVKFDQGYFPADSQSSVNPVIALGGGIEYKVSRHAIIRAVDFELQKWPNFFPHSLTPYMVTTGLAYRF